MHIRFEPQKDFERFTRKFADIAKEFEKGITIETGGFKPRVNILEDDNNIYFEAELAGINKENVKVSVNEENILTVKGDKPKNLIENSKILQRSERKFGEFNRSFQLPNNTDKTKIDAKFENGILNLIISKITPEKPIEHEVTIN